MENERLSCRLCHYQCENSIFMTNINQKEYCAKISKHLHIKVGLENDAMSKFICFHCSQSLDLFSCFFEKIHEVQRATLANYNEHLLSLNTSEAETDTAIVKSASDLPKIIAVETISNDFYKTEIESTEVVEVHVPPQLVSDRRTRRRKPAKNYEEEFDNLKNLDVVDNRGKLVEDDSQTSHNEGILLYYNDKDLKASSVSTNWNLQNQSKFPSKIIENGLLLFKGQKLMEIVNKFYKNACEICGDQTLSIKQLLAHYLEVHNVDGYVNCCDLKLYRMPNIIIHMAKHLQPEAFSCDICGYQVSRPRFLALHRQTHLPDDKKPLVCDICSKTFCWKGALQAHMTNHIPKENRKQFECSVCGKKYENAGSLSTHKKLIHKKREEDPLICQTCGKIFKNRNALKEHQQLHQENQEKYQLQCKECGRWLKNKRCLKSHMLLHSTVEHSCSMCNYKTKKKILLNRHLITQHSNEKKFDCHLCEKKFKLKRALTVHLQQHTSTPKSYKCEFCNRIFANSTNFYTHRKNLHPKELDEMKNRKLEEQRMKRIEAGIESDDNPNNRNQVIIANDTIADTFHSLPQ